ncbi:MAG: dipeptidyl carboxypeptidase II, partial [Thermomonas sp.]
MKYPITCALALAISTALAGCATTTAPGTASTMETPMPASSFASNPFAAPSPLPLHFPQFDKIKDADFAPAFDRGIVDQRQEMDAIAANPQPASFDNTILAMERSGQLLGRAMYVFGNLTGANTNDTLDKLDAEYSPKFAAAHDAIYLNPALFQRIKTLYDNRSTLGLDAEGVRLVERYYSDFVRAGANLDPAQKERVKAINGELATLQTTFNQDVLAEVNDSAIIVDNRADLAGLSDEQIQVLADNAKAKGLEGKYRIALLNTTGQPVEAQLDNRALRERIYRASINRGSRGNQWDTRNIVSKV